MNITASGFPSALLKLPAVDSVSHFHVANASFLFVISTSSRRVLSDTLFRLCNIIAKLYQRKIFFFYNELGSGNVFVIR
jgi:hypothetical protein